MRMLVAMLCVGLAAGVARAGEAPAPEAPPAPAPAAPEYTRAPRRGDVGVFILADGRRVRGKLLAASELAAVIKLDDGKRLVLKGKQLVAVVPREGPPPSFGLAPDGVRVFLRGGGVIEGRLAARDDDAVRVETGEGIRAIGPGLAREVWLAKGRVRAPRVFVDGARFHGLGTPTALVLDPGELAFSGNRLVAGSVSAGLFRGAMITAGTIAPAGWADRYGGNVFLGGRYALAIGPWVRVAAGLEAFLAPSGNVIDAYGAITGGQRDLWVSLAVTPPPRGAEVLGDLGDRVFAATGYWRFHRHVAVLAEVWGGDGDPVVAAGARLLLRRAALDLGVAATRGEVVPLLSLDLTWLLP